jgi:hypothetical protein
MFIKRNSPLKEFKKLAIDLDRLINDLLDESMRDAKKVREA